MKYGTLVRIPEGADIQRACEEKFGKLQKMGLDACQLVYKPAVYTPEDAELIRDCAKACKIEISAQFCGYYDGLYTWDTYYDYHLAGINSPVFGAERVRYLLSAIPFMKRLGVSDMIIHGGFISNNPFAQDYTQMLACVRLLGSRLAAEGMNLLFETGGESPVTLLRLFEDSGLNNLYVNLDTANLIMYGYGNPVDAVYTYGKYVRNMHAKDGFPPTAGRRLGREVPIGSGYVDFERVLGDLAKLGYDRYVIIECEIQGKDHEAEIAKAFGYLKGIVKKVMPEGN